MKILVCAEVSREAFGALCQAGWTVDFCAEPKDLPEIIDGYAGLIVSRGVAVDSALLAKGAALKLVAVLDKDLSAIDVEAATALGIAVLNSSSGVAASLAEYVMLLLLETARAGDGLGMELRGKTLGIIGLGSVGTQVAKRARAFEMEVVAYDPWVKRSRALMCDVELENDMEDLLSHSDFVSLHLPLNDYTRGLLTADELALMKADAYLLNVQDAELCELPDLAEALTHGVLKGALFDVPYLPPELAALPNVRLSHNRAAATLEAQQGAAWELSEEVAHFLQSGISANAVNLPQEPKLYGEAKAYPRLLALLAQCLRQLGDKPCQVELIIQNVSADMDPDYALGLLFSVLLAHEERVNLISARAIAHSLDIGAIWVLEPGDAYDIGIKYQGEDKTIFLAGVVKNGEPRLTVYNDFQLDLPLRERYLFIPHDNKPGMIGLVGTILGQYGVNISGMLLSQQAKDCAKAMMVMMIDDAISADALAAIKNNDGIDDARFVRLDKLHEER